MNWLEIELKWQNMTRRAQGTPLVQPQNAVLKKLGADATTVGKGAGRVHLDAEAASAVPNLRTL